MEKKTGEKSELFIGLVGAAGSNLKSVQRHIKEILSQFDYEVKIFKFSDFLEEEYFNQIFDCPINDKLDSFKVIYSQMEAGNQVRKKTRPSILAEYAIGKINTFRRNKETTDGNSSNGMVYLFDSLKNPDEAKALISIYGAAYYQIGVFSSERQRVSYLLKEKGIQKSNAYRLIEKDIAEEDKSGQQTRDTFKLSDFFIKHNHEDEVATKRQLERIFDLIFGHPHITPTIDEHMMYMAYSYSTRSADLSRQVGAVVANKLGDISGLGSNDVPRSGGGPYWPCPDMDNINDWRDYRKEEDANQINRNKMIIKAMKALRDNTALKDEHKDDQDQVLLKKGLEYFKDTGLLDITEFGRATHAEMSAILSCSRNGVSPKGKTLYCTTFPCHNCAKHIVESGIKKVLFVEPYPKSLAEDLHSDAISILGTDGDKVVFDHFIGVAARRYLDLFSLKLGMGTPLERKNKETGRVKTFDRKGSKVKVHVGIDSYLKQERHILTKFNP